MTRMIFVNLPVADVAASTAFYEAMGARKDERFCDGSTSMMALSDTINVMLLDHDRFQSFTPKAIADARTTSEVLLCVTADSRAEVDATVDRAGTAGGRVDPCPQQDYGFMYGRSYEDPDGHIWEVTWMDVDAAMAAREQIAESASA
jgi:predicted lactoylglutathione lyase